MFEKKCEKCGTLATVQLNLERYLCSQHAFDAIKSAEGDEARKLRLRPAR
jgi:hypothetical protein